MNGRCAFCPHCAANRPLDEAIEALSNRYGVSYSMVLSHDRRAWLVRVRQLTMWALRQRGFTYAEIGRAFERDHTTVMYAVAKVNRLLRSRDPWLFAETETLTLEARP